MKKSLKKAIALILTLVMLMSAFVGVLSAFAEDEPEVTEAADVTEAEKGEEDFEHNSFFNIFVRFWKEVLSFWKYILYDVLLGKPAPEIPPMPETVPHAA